MLAASKRSKCLKFKKSFIFLNFKHTFFHSQLGDKAPKQYLRDYIVRKLPRLVHRSIGPDN